MNSLNDRNAEGEQLPEHPLVQCCKFQDKELRFSSDFSETLTVEVETVAQNELFDTLSERFVQHILCHGHAKYQQFESIYIATIIVFHL